MRARLGTYYSRLVSRFVPGVEFRLPRSQRRTADGRPALHLSFDDGPTDETPALLDVLAEFDVPATFYLLGENAERHPQHVRAIVDAGHVVGNHSQTHVDAWKVTPADVDREFDEATRVLEGLTGGPLVTMRPPFGRLNKAVVRWSRRSRQPIAMWDLMPPDFEPGSTPDRVARNLVRGVRPGSIVVLHDNAKSRGVTVPALRLALPELLATGWAFVPLTVSATSARRAA